jgi:hypothetical protein
MIIFALAPVRGFATLRFSDTIRRRVSQIHHVGSSKSSSGYKPTIILSTMADSHESSDRFIDHHILVGISFSFPTIHAVTSVVSTRS